MHNISLCLINKHLFSPSLGKIDELVYVEEQWQGKMVNATKTCPLLRGQGVSWRFVVLLILLSIFGIFNIGSKLASMRTCYASA